MAPPRLEVRALDKRFGGLRALAEANVTVQPGSIHALLGENGAGKSTLVKIVTGVQPADGGRVLLDGEDVRFASPMEARAAGVVAVYQDPRLFPHLDVAENIFMGVHPRTALGMVARRRMYEDARRLLDEIGAEIDVRQPVMGLSIGAAQFVEFARAMAVGQMRLLFLDEPTASLTPAEADRLFALARRLAAQGTAVVFISHRLEEMAGFVDDVTILRDGRDVLRAPAETLDQGKIVKAMVGRDMAELYAPRPAAERNGARETLLDVERLTAAGEFSDVTFSLRAGEVVGMAGLVGAGRSEIALGILGMMKTTGTVSVAGKPVATRSPRAMKESGVAYVPEDRDHHGLVTSHASASNISLASLQELASLGIVQRREERRFVGDLVERLAIKAGDLSNAVSTLSGGNRQKVVIAKWLARNPRIFILDEPTHGIDIGTKATIHRLIAELAEAGAALLVISSDLPEVIAISDRILVVRQGRIVGEVDRAKASEEHVMALATGQAVAEAAA